MVRMLRWASIADDFTGATDLATNLVSRGYATSVVFGSPELPELADIRTELDGADAVIVALKSRTAPVDDAVAASLAAHALIAEVGAQRWYVKYCSTFDSTPEGNIGPIIDAIMTAEGVDQTIVVPAFPAGGRTVSGGDLFVNGVPLDESSMRNHPLTPMTDANIPRLLAPQTRGVVASIALEVVRRGAVALRDELARLRSDRPTLVVIDAVTDDDLRTIDEASIDLRLVTGGSGLAVGLPRRERDDDVRRIPLAPGRRAVLCGSASAMTRAQVAYGKRSLPWRKIVPDALAADLTGFVDEALAWATLLWERDADAIPLFFSVEDLADVAASKSASELVERALAEIAFGLVAHGATQLLVAGGETAGRVVGRLGVPSLRIGPEIAPGVAWASGRDRSGRELNLALKSGNFGAESMFVTAWEVLA